MRYVISFLLGAVVSVAGLYAAVKNGTDLPLPSRPASVESVVAAAELPPPGPPSGDSLERFLTGEPGQDIVDREVIGRANNIAGEIRKANVRLRREILIRENQLMCLRCGEQNPATAEKGYPIESCHKCCMESLRDPTMGTVANPGIEEPEELKYPPPGLTPEEFQKRLAAWKAFSERYELDKIRQALLKMSPADRERLLMSIRADTIASTGKE